MIAVKRFLKNYSKLKSTLKYNQNKIKIVVSIINSTIRDIPSVSELTPQSERLRLLKTS